MDANALRERWQAVLQRLADAARLAGRDPADVALLAVSKLHPAQDIAVLAACGQRDFGENYVQEALGKQATLADDPSCAHIRWHCVGHVQSRKVKEIVGRFACVHTVDSAKLAHEFDKRCAVAGVRQSVLIQVNVGAEAQKSGVAVDDLPALAETVAACPHLTLDGLMCLPPVFDAGEAARPYFALLRELREALRTRLGLALPQLSMGMSGDAEAAVKEGATIVRVGTDIFGARTA